MGAWLRTRDLSRVKKHVRLWPEGRSPCKSGGFGPPASTATVLRLGAITGDTGSGTPLLPIAR
jgi:hypothetical protein